MPIKGKLLLIRNHPTPVLENVLFNIIGADPDVIDEGSFDPSIHKAILTVGEDALESVGRAGAFRNARKKLDHEGTPLYPLPEDIYVEENPSYMEKYAQQAYTAYMEVTGGNKYENQNVLIDNAFQVWDLIAYIRESGYCSFDFETIGLNPYADDFRVVAMSLSFQQGSSYVLLLDHRDATTAPFIKNFIELFNDEVFGDPDIVKIAHNIKFDLHCAYQIGIHKFHGRFHDTMVMSHLIDEDSPNRLKFLVGEHYPRFANYESELSSMNWDSVETKSLVKYAGLDADLTLRLYWIFTDILMQDSRLYNYFRNLSAPATKVLFKMEQRGMLVDKNHIVKSIEEVEELIDSQLDKMHDYEEVMKFNVHLGKIQTDAYLKKYEETIDKLNEIAEGKKDKGTELTKLQQQKLEEALEYKDFAEKGGIETVEVNFGSPKQLADLLYTDKGFNFEPHKDWGGKPIYSTNKDVLEHIKDKTGFLTDIRILRQLSKINSTYLKAVRDLLTTDHRIHSKFNQNGTKTGRLSSTNPNLQNIITRTKYKEVEKAVSLVKKSFIPPQGCSIVQLDLSQAELRFMAFYAKEDTMLKAYKDGKDLHALTAASVKKMSLDKWLKLDDKVKKKDRFEAKAWNFGNIYLISAKGLQEYAKVNYGIDISEKKAAQIQDIFFNTYPKLRSYHNLYINKAKKFGYVRTLFGRKVRLPDIYSLDKFKYGHAQRNAVNSPIQGTGGEYTILGLVILDLRMPELQIVNSVHDSIIPYIQDEILDESIKEAKHHFENLPIELYFGKKIDTVDMRVDIEVSKDSWGDLKEIQ